MMRSQLLTRGAGAQMALAFFEAFSPIYTVIFVIVRSVIGPPAVVWLSMRLVDTPGLPPSVRCDPAATSALSCFPRGMRDYAGRCDHMHGRSPPSKPSAD